MTSAHSLSGPSPLFERYVPLALTVLASLLYLQKVNIFTSDDIFTYFNYARNFGEGRFLAIDNRNIPSEGFTSVLYMLLLVPFSLTGINMMLSGLVLNLIAIYFTAYFTARILGKVFGLTVFSQRLLVPLYILLSGLVVDMPAITGWAFETLWSPLFLSMMLWYAIDSNGTRFDGRVIATYILGMLIRPENLLLYSPVWLFLLFSFGLRDWKKFAAMCATVFALLALYLVFKQLVFGDLFPTGYYRKLRNEVQSSVAVYSSLAYLTGYVTSHPVLLPLSLVLGAAPLAIWRGLPKGNLPYWRVFAMFLLVAGLTAGFNMMITPLMGMNYRYLVLLNFACLGLLVAGFAALTHLRIAPARLTPYALTSVLLLLSAYTFYLSRHLSLNPRHLVTEARNQYNDMPYLTFGRYLKENLRNSRALTISMGDGGAVPYAAECNTIDPAGLTEPYNARLTARKDDRKLADFIKYLDSQNIDLVMLTMGVNQDKLNTEPCWDWLHLPINQREYVGYLRHISEHGYVYVGTWRIFGSYTWHFIVNKNGKNFQELVPVLKKFLVGRGFVFENSYNIVCPEFTQSKVTFKQI